MKKVVCGNFGTIYYAQILQNGLMSSSNRVDITDDAIIAVMDHLMMQSQYREENGFAGYEYGTKKKDGHPIVICVYDKGTHECRKRDMWNKFDPAVLPTQTKEIGEFKFSKPLIIHLKDGADYCGYCNVTTGEWFIFDEVIEPERIEAWCYYRPYGEK